MQCQYNYPVSGITEHHEDSFTSMKGIIPDNGLTLEDYKEEQLVLKQEPAYSTGWLKGALSYPWAIVSVIIPSYLENIF